MEIKYLGTAAAECIPGMFCNCPTCERTRELGGRNIRTRFQIAIDGTILIDFGPDTYYHIINHGLKLTDITTCLITHGHTDHLRYEDFELRKKQLAHGDLKPMHVFGTAPTAAKIEPVIEKYKLDEQDRVFFHCIEAFQTFESDSYTITPLAAAHDPKSEPVFYMIQAGGKTAIFAHDTGWFLDETWDYLTSLKQPADFISLDCTGGINEEAGRVHMSFVNNIELRKEMYERGIANRDTKFYLSHFSHNGRAVHDDFLSVAGKEGFDVAYDGLAVTLNTL